MRRMQTSNRNALTQRIAHGTISRAALLAAGLISLLGSQLFAQNQSSNYFPVSPATMNLGSNPISSANRSAVVDSAYRPGSGEDSEVETASYLGDWGYETLNQAECCPGAYSCTRCDFDWYFSGELLGFRREGDRRFSLTNAVLMNDVEFELGTRATIGKMCDCATAYEFVYVGPFQWGRRSDTGVNSRFAAFPFSLDDAFNGATSHTQTWIGRASSYEFNRRRWAWDAVSTMIGMRYFNYEEDYRLRSVRAVAPITGLYTDEIQNHLIGPQVGGDIFFLTSLKTSLSLRGKAGVFANFAEREVRLVEDGTTLLFNGKDKVDVAGLFELGINFNYQFTPSIRLSGGYEVWYMPGMGVVSDQNPALLTVDSGTRLRLHDDFFLHGFNGGVQLLY